jgi:lipid II:glycine glycyltransferase (peptidoglycan interpeptide bridge formation enzyme)
MPAIFLDPLSDSRYESFVNSYPEAAVFHTPAWIRVLHETYGFKPGCVAIEEDGRLQGALPYMETRSLTGKRRCVSLPFSDFCEPLFASGEDFTLAFEALKKKADSENWRYIELRGGMRFLPDAPPVETIFTHDIDLGLQEDLLLDRLRPSIKRNIRRAKTGGVAISFAKSYVAIQHFELLNRQTRRWHGLPPQPHALFCNIQRYIVERNNGFVSLAKVNDIIIAASIYYLLGNKAYFKYGASDRKYHHLRPNDLMLWKSALYCKKMACRTLNLGRTEKQHAGLLHFKQGYHGVESQAKYYRFTPNSKMFLENGKKRTNVISHIICTKTPHFLLRLVGELFYRYEG